jgi:phosphoglycerate dehydrogenase-like enzyme
MCLPGTPETDNILSKERIKLLPKDAYVVNVGRGSAIDEDALADSLDEKRLAGAALDVFKNEPLPKESRLWKTKNLIITPHVAGNLTLEHTLDKNVEMFIDNLLSYANGLEMKHVIDRNKGY